MGSGHYLSQPAGEDRAERVRRLFQACPPHLLGEDECACESLVRPHLRSSAHRMTLPKNAKVAVIGGGLAGLSAGCALADAGMQVTLFERRPYLGGRAPSYEHPGTNETVDNCQHVLLRGGAPTEIGAP